MKEGVHVYAMVSILNEGGIMTREKKNPYEELLDQLNKLLEFVKTQSKTPPNELKIVDNTDKKLRDLALAIETFGRLSEFIVGFSGISKEELQMRLLGISSQLNPDAKRIIDKASAAKRSIQQLKEKYEADSEFVPHSKKVDDSAPVAAQPKDADNSLTESQKQQKRRGKFKRIGGDERWKPL